MRKGLLQKERDKADLTDICNFPDWRVFGKRKDGTNDDHSGSLESRDIYTGKVVTLRNRGLMCRAHMIMCGPFQECPTKHLHWNVLPKERQSL